MSVDNKVSVLIEQQFPDFMYEEGLTFIQFVKAYYEWMEESGNALDASKSLLDYQDLDTTLDQYLEYFHRELMGPIPREILADRRQLAKHIKDLYRSKGSEESYELLFRILFNEEINFYFPGEDILRASDGRWVEEVQVRLTPLTGDITYFIGYMMRGLTSGALGRVERLTAVNKGGLNFYDAIISHVSGTFVDGETVQNNDGSITAIIDNTIGKLQELTIVTGGKGHVVGDAVNILSVIGSGAQGVVTEVSNTSSLEFTLVDGGDGYRISSIEPGYPAGNPASGSVSVIGGPGSGAAFIVTEITPTSSANVSSDLIQSLQNVVLNTGPQFDSANTHTPPISASLASANITSTIASALTFSNVEFGIIKTIKTIDPGGGYTSLPTVQVIDAEIQSTLGGGYGANAIVTPSFANGGISKVDIDDSIITSYNKNALLTIVNTARANTFNATATANTTSVITFPGRYTDTKGFLSWNMRLQDNFYYQEFSYEIGTNQVINSYRKLVHSLLHPAGTLMFGRKRVYTTEVLPEMTANTFANTGAI